MNAPVPDAAGTPTLQAVLILFIFSLLGAVAAWGALKPTGNLFPLPPEAASGGATPDLTPEALRAIREKELKETSVQVAVVGACACGLLGMGMGLAARSVLGVIVGLLLGAIFGGGFGAAAGLADQLLFLDLPEIKVSRLDIEPKAFQTMVAHAALWGILSFPLALIAGFITRSGRGLLKALLAALAAALVSALLFPLLAPLALPISQVEEPVPNGVPYDLVRIVWVGLWGGICAIAIGRMLKFGAPPVRPLETRPTEPGPEPA